MLEYKNKTIKTNKKSFCTDSCNTPLIANALKSPPSPSPLCDALFSWLWAPPAAQHHPSHVPTASPLTCPNSTSLQRNVQDLKINSTFNRLYIQVGCREPAEVKADTRNAPSAKHWNMNKKIRTAHLDMWSAVTCPKIVSLQRSALW